MFTKSELLNQYEVLLSRPSLAVSQEGFKTDAEGGVIVSRGSTRDFEGALHFYCSALVAQELDGHLPEYRDWHNIWQGFVKDQIKAALCMPLDKDQFQERTKSVLSPTQSSVKLPDVGGFKEALQMEDEWNDIGILAEFDTEFVYVYWHTSG